MKLYGTIASERASKGQGGNDYLKIRLTVGSTKNIIDFGTLILDQREDEDGNKEAFVLTFNGDEIASYNPNEVKGECTKKDSNGNACYDCESGQGMACGSTSEA